MDALKMKLPGRDSARPGHPENVRSRELYLKGRFHSFRLTRSGIEAGIPCFEEAIELDRSYALAQVGLAHAYRMFGMSLDMPTSEVGPKAIAAARKAVEMDGSLAEAHAALSLSLFFYEWEWSAAEKHARRAVELGPNSADAHWSYAHLCSNVGRHAESLALISRARELDPLSGLINAMEGQFLLHAGRTREAIARLREAIELDPKSRVAHMFLASAYIETGLFSEAIAEAGAASALSLATLQIAFESYANAKLGKSGDARNALERLLQLSTKRYVPPYNIALIYMGLGEGTEALTWLDRAFEERDPRMVFLKVEPKWKSLHSNPRYVQLLNRMNLLA
jgi:tetratricopeptide (TPR) repeat protein